MDLARVLVGLSEAYRGIRSSRVLTRAGRVLPKAGREHENKVWKYGNMLPYLAAFDWGLKLRDTELSSSSSRS